MTKRNIEDIYQLSPLQQGMLYHGLSEPASGVYLIHLSYDLEGTLVESSFWQAWQRVAARHPPLRTSFHWRDTDMPVQVVHSDIELPTDTYDWRDIPEAELAASLATLEAEQQRPFDFDKAPLMRLALARLSDDRYRFCWTFHHILMEGWSVSFVLQEVIECYRAAVENREVELSPRKPFRDYVVWLQEQDAAKAERYWGNTLRGFTAPTPLLPREAGTRAFESEDNPNYLVSSTILSEDATARLDSLARNHGLTLNTMVQGAWALLLSRYSGERDVVFGTVVSGRSGALAGIESMVGLFVNTLPTRVPVEPDELLFPWLKRIQADQVASREYEWSSLIDIQGWSDVPRGVPLFESILVFENWEGDTFASHWSDDLAIRDVRWVEAGTGYPLTVLVGPGSRLSLAFSFDERRFDPPAIRRMLEHLRTILASMVAVPEQPVSSIQMLTPDERHRLLAAWNDTNADYPADMCLHRLIEAQAAKTPEAEAVVFESQRFTYAELNRRANLLCHYLRAKGVGPGVLVAVCMDRCADIPVALLGVLKAGGAYVPLDSEYPAQRLAFMVEDSRAAIVLTQKDLVETLQITNAQIVRIDADWKDIAKEDPHNPVPLSTPQDLAYLMYTSGSTGKPKAVEIRNRALVNFLSSMKREPGISERDRLLAVTTIAFDIAGLEIYLPLLAGARVEIVSRDVAGDGRRLAQAITESGATVMQATPATWRMLVDDEWEGNDQLKILCGGEALSRELADQLLERSAEVWNLYGPTETTIWSTLERVLPGKGPVPIGRPIANTQVYLLDSRQTPVPIGVPGEVLIGGDGVASGYRDRPELTEDRFIRDPFSNDTRRLYRTGDLGKWLPDGRIEYLGRMDHQIKIRGFRIEPAEIETAIVSHDAVRQAVVDVREDPTGDPRLVAYVVYQTGYDLTVTEARRFLRQKLPNYMVPALFVTMEALPRTPNAKIDRNALPDPFRSERLRNTDYVAPLTATEQLIAGVWQKLLAVDRVGRNDTFFELGGHSLLSLRAVSAIERKAGRRLDHRVFFFGSLEQIAAAYDTNAEPAVPPETTFPVRLRSGMIE